MFYWLKLILKLFIYSALKNITHFYFVLLQRECSQTRADRSSQRPEHAIQKEFRARFDHSDR